MKKLLNKFFRLFDPTTDLFLLLIKVPVAIFKTLVCAIFILCIPIAGPFAGGNLLAELLFKHKIIEPGNKANAENAFIILFLLIQVSVIWMYIVTRS